MNNKNANGYNTITIKDAIDNIANQEMVLAPFQRDYVWNDKQVYRLFDSILRGYPIGTILLWVTKRSVAEEHGYDMYELSYDYKDGEPNRLVPSPSTSGNEFIRAVLDGQQRLTSMYIALQGRICRKPRHCKKGRSYPKKELYFDLRSPGCANWQECGHHETVAYRFRFLTEEEAANRKKGKFLV